MSENSRVLLIQVSGATGGTTVIVVPKGRASMVVIQTSEPCRDRQLRPVPVAETLVQALSGSATLELMRWAQRISWAEVLHWLTSWTS